MIEDALRIDDTTPKRFCMVAANVFAPSPAFVEPSSDKTAAFRELSDA